MRIAFDLDGTVFNYPDLYVKIATLFSKEHEIIILTGRPEEYKKKDQELLRSIGFPMWDAYYCSDLTEMENSLAEKAVYMKRFFHRDDIICVMKARLIVQHSIDILFDDAADKIRHVLEPEDEKVHLILKSPTTENLIMPRWERGGFIQYDKI